MSEKKYCGQCHWFEKSECWCYQLNNHRKPLQQACGGFDPKGK